MYVCESQSYLVSKYLKMELLTVVNYLVGAENLTQVLNNS